MLATPKTSKELEDGAARNGGHMAFGLAAMQGWRLRMEDAHLAIPDFDSSRRLGLFGVFDGHGGAAVAKVVAAWFPKLLRKQPSFQQGNFTEALRETFFRMDEYLDSSEGRKEVIQLAASNPASDDEEGPEEEDDSDDDMPLDLEDEEEEEAEEEEAEIDRMWDKDLKQLLDENEPSTYELWISGEGPDCMGTTAVVALVRFGDNPEIFVANAGDSRCVLSTDARAVDMSHDHKPVLKNERARIKRAGGFITDVPMGGRVDGNLSLSRAFGDFAYKKNKRLKPTEQRIVCEPEIMHRRLRTSDRLVILGCDGIWEKASSQSVVSFLLGKLGKSKRLSSACAAFLDSNLASTPIADAGLGCDNMTLMAVDLQAGETPHSLRRQPSKLEVRRRIGKKSLPSRGRRSPALRRRDLLLACRSQSRRNRIRC